MKKLLLLLTFFSNYQFLQSAHAQPSKEEQAILENLASQLNDTGTDFLLKVPFEKLLDDNFRTKRRNEFSDYTTPTASTQSLEKRVSKPPQRFTDYIQQKRKQKQPEKEEKTEDGQEFKEEEEDSQSETQDEEEDSQSETEDKESEKSDQKKKTVRKSALPCPVASCKEQIKFSNTTILFHFIINHGIQGIQKQEVNTCPFLGCNYNLTTAEALRAHINRKHSKRKKACRVNFGGFCNECKTYIAQIKRNKNAQKLVNHLGHELALVLTSKAFNPTKIKEGRFYERPKKK